MVDVAQLVSQMHETLSTIHSTISSLSVLDHESRLDDLEQRRDAAVDALQSGFALASDQLAQKRQAQLSAIATQRRREDEERDARRRQEDEALRTQAAEEDTSRNDQLSKDVREVEESTESMMGNVEQEAKRMLEEGKAKLAALEERRRELNRLIDEQLQLPLPSAPSRRKFKERRQPQPELAVSNPVATMEKHNDCGDGDRDAILVEAKANTAEEVPAGEDHDNQKYLQEASSHIVPGGFPASALQSPTSEELNTSTVLKVAIDEINDETDSQLDRGLSAAGLQQETLMGQVDPTEPEEHLRHAVSVHHEQNAVPISDTQEHNHADPALHCDASEVAVSDATTEDYPLQVQGLTEVAPMSSEDIAATQPSQHEAPTSVQNYSSLNTVPSSDPKGLDSPDGLNSPDGPVDSDTQTSPPTSLSPRDRKEQASEAVYTEDGHDDENQPLEQQAVDTARPLDQHLGEAVRETDETPSAVTTAEDRTPFPPEDLSVLEPHLQEENAENGNEDVRDDADHTLKYRFEDMNEASNNVPTTSAVAWNYQEALAAPEVYAYAAPEYVDYSSSYYVPGQQNLDLSPVLEAASEPLQAHHSPSSLHQHEDTGDDDVSRYDNAAPHDSVVLNQCDNAAPASTHGTGHGITSIDDNGQLGAKSVHEENIAAPVIDVGHHEQALEAENAVTVHGQDSLFDYNEDEDGDGDGGSEGSEESASSEFVYSPKDDQFEYENVLSYSQDRKATVHVVDRPVHEETSDVPETPTTIVGDAHPHSTKDGAREAKGQSHFESSLSLEEPGTATLLSDRVYLPSVLVQDRTENITRTSIPSDRSMTPEPAASQVSPFKGLASSRHAPRTDEPEELVDTLQQPVTPPRQTAGHGTTQGQDTPSSNGSGPSDGTPGADEFMPRDVTHVAWQERNADTTPGSTRSQATLSVSSASNSPSPWAAAVTPGNNYGGADERGSIVYSSRQDPRRDEPFIRSSWSSTPEGYAAETEATDKSLLLGRGKPIGQLDYQGTVFDHPEDGEHLVIDTTVPPATTTDGQQPLHPTSSRPSSIHASPPSNLFRRMRSIFEPPGGGAASPPTEHEGGLRLGSGSLAQLPKANQAPAPRDPYPATSNTANKLVDGGFLRGVKPVPVADSGLGHGHNDYHHHHREDDDDDVISEKSSLLQAAAIVEPSY